MTIGLDLQVFRAAYARFLDAPEAASRVLLTGHSHQAWPDVARDALAQCFDDAPLGRRPRITPSHRIVTSGSCAHLQRRPHHRIAGIG